MKTNINVADKFLEDRNKLLKVCIKKMNHAIFTEGK